MFSLSRQEQQVILFLLAVTLAGMGFSFLLQNYAQVKFIACLSEDIGKIDLNHADKDTLKSVKGIGEKLARRIIEYRNRESGFQDLQELKNIPGITNPKYEKIKEAFIIR
jgi:competence ComEA-like helix-hairpin-helix protein